MMLISAFVLGILASFIGSLPLGVLNLSVIRIAGNRNLRQAYLFSFGAATVEFVQAFVAIWFASWLVTKSLLGGFLEIMVIPILLLFGVYYWTRKSKSTTSNQTSEYKFSGFSQGAFLSIINPIAIPFWIFYSAWFYSNNWINYDFPEIVLLVAGISIGTFLCLALYGLLGNYIYKEISFIRTRMNQIIGAIFILLAIIQGINIFL